jgi:hypothetical protein
MDTLDRLMPREAETADRDVSVNRDADFNPDAVVDDPGGKGSALPDAYLDGGDEIESEPFLSGWQIAAAVAGGIAAVAVVAGIAGVAYWRINQAQVVKPQTFWAQKRTMLARAHPRELSRMAGRRIEQLPVRDMQKRIANRVSHLFG